MTDAVIEFAKWVIQESVFDGCDLDGGIVQEKALKLGLLTKTSYDPEKHGGNEYVEPGSDWYMFSNLLTQTDPSPAPGGQQPVAWMDATGTELHKIIQDYQKRDMIASGGRQAERAPNYSIALFTRPSEQAVTEAMVEAAISIMFRKHGWFPPKWVVKDALKAAMEVGR